jgi:hypothetical protein
MSSNSPSAQESRCWRIAQFKNNWGDLHQIDLDTLEADPDPLVLCSLGEHAIRWASKSPLRRRSSPSPTQSLALSNAAATRAAFSCLENDLRPFCDCASISGRRTPTGITCGCGEPPSGSGQSPSWQWRSAEGCTATQVTSDGRQVHFHQGRSVGTAAVRGTQTFALEQQYFWEVKLTSPMFGTDVVRLSFFFPQSNQTANMNFNFEFN